MGLLESSGRPIFVSQSRSWYEIKNAVNGATDIYLYDEIGLWGITAQSFVDALSTVKSKTINLFVNSPGGGVEDGIAIFNALQRHPATVNGTVDGMAASIASVIFQAADGRRAMGAGSTMMIHEPYGMAMGDVATMAKMGEYLDIEAENIAGIYAGRAGGTPADWRAKMKDETWYNAKDAVAAGLADELVGAKGASNLVAGRAFNLSKFKNVPDWVQNGAKSALVRPKLARNAAGDVTLTADQLEQIDTYLDAVEASCEAACASVDAIEALLGIEDEPDMGGMDAKKPSRTPMMAAEARKWPLLVHHDASGAVVGLDLALKRARNFDIDMKDREEAIRHLESHRRVA